MSVVCLVSLGSAGDVHPMLALGQALGERGHRAVVMTNPVFEGMVRGAGLEFDAIGRAEEHASTVAHPKLWHPVDGLGVMWRYLLRPALEPTFERLSAWSAQGPCVVLANPLAMGARVAQEKLGLPLMSVYTAPTLLRSVHPPLTLAQWSVPRWMPHWALQGAWHALDRWKLQPLVKPALERLRQAQGLAPIKGSVFGHWMHSPQAGVALFPKWFAPAPPDWPGQVVQADFVRYSDGDTALPESLQLFLVQGDAPVVFMPGTARHHTDEFFAEAMQACAAMGLRGVFLGHLSQALQARVAAQPAQIWAGAYVPFADVLPHARALVHHGGIGTSAQALHAGVPQLVVPCAYDQFDNALRLQRLGVAQVLPSPGQGRLQTHLQSLLADPGLVDACWRWAGQGSAQEARRQVCDAVGRLA
jgi:rhamnosyltransferase subunit B